MFQQIYKILSNFGSNPLTCDTTLFPGKNSPNFANSNRVFPGKGRGDRAFILTYLDSPIVEVFPPCCLSKVQTLGPFLFNENSNPSNIFQTMFLFTRVLHLVRISALFDHTWWSKAQNPPKKDNFMDAESVRKALKTFNLTTTTAILIKLTAIMYLHESVNRKPLRVRN